MSGRRPDRVKVKFDCRYRNHLPHDLCVTVNRGLPRELQCAEGQGAGYGPGGGSGCTIPRDLDVLVERELRGHFQASKRQGFVLIRAA